MLRARPFESDEQVLELATQIWGGLGPSDWLEAFAQHPRIGQLGEGERAAGATREWAAREQAGALTASAAVRAEFALANRRYEERFGHVFLICATGRSAAEMRDALEARMGNDPEEELRVAAGEQAKITHLRLLRLADTTWPTTPGNGDAH